MRDTILIAAALLGLQATPSSALELDLFGHNVWLKGSYPEMELLVDGRTFLADAIVAIDGIHLIGATPVLLGNSSGGGNACEAAPFVLSFPIGGAPRLDGPLQTCFLVAVMIENNFLRFEAALPGDGAEVWTWKPEVGFTDAAAIVRPIDHSRGWNELRERKVVHPADLLEYGEIAAQVDVLLADDRNLFRDILSGIGSGEFIGDNYLGKTCMPHECGSIEGLIFLDASQQQVYLAWKPEDAPIVVRPAVSGWPDPARHELRKWADKWQ